MNDAPAPDDDRPDTPPVDTPNDGPAPDAPSGDDRGGAGPRAPDEPPSQQVVPHRSAPPSAAGGPRPPRRTGVFVDADELRAHVGDLLRAMLGGYSVDAFGNLTFEHEGAQVFVTVGPGPLGPQVGVFSITTVDVDLGPDLAGWLLGANHRLAFGAFSYDAENRAIWLRHSLLGGTLDGPELRGAVLSVASTAARVQGGIAERFGGRRFSDADEEAQAAARPPEPSDEDDDVVNASGYL